jgi:putative two-component system hydrogenase maturation factor HypX/HoxX
MRILLFTTTHNGLSQRTYVELVERGHTVSVQPVNSEAAMEAAAAHFQPQLIIASFLKKAVPARLLQKYTVLSVRSGAGADRGAATVDGNISENLQNWRITLFQANAERDIISNHSISQSFGRHMNGKNSFYKHHVAQAVVHDILETVEKYDRKTFAANALEMIDSMIKTRLQSTYF